MECEESFITIKLMCHGYLISSLGICVHKTPTDTGLKKYQQLVSRHLSLQLFRASATRVACHPPRRAHALVRVTRHHTSRFLKDRGGRGYT